MINQFHCHIPFSGRTDLQHLKTGHRDTHLMVFRIRCKKFIVFYSNRLIYIFL